MSETFDHCLNMFDSGRLGEEIAHQYPPELEIGGFTETDHMVVHAVPTDDQAKGQGLLDGAFQLHAAATLCCLEQGNGLAHAIDERTLLTILDEKTRYLENHV